MQHISKHDVPFMFKMMWTESIRRNKWVPRSTSKKAVKLLSNLMLYFISQHSCKAVRAGNGRTFQDKSSLMCSIKNMTILNVLDLTVRSCTYEPSNTCRRIVISFTFILTFKKKKLKTWGFASSNTVCCHMAECSASNSP